MIEKKLPQIYYGLITVTFFILLYFSITLLARGDEGGAYLPTFQQAYEKWPALDMSPYWAVSSFYLWIIDGILYGLASLGLLGDYLLLIGRVFSLLCWLILVCTHATSGKYKAMAILFNPYVLIYASRAHPLLPAILLFYLFWILIRQNKKIGLLFLLFAVNFQVFTGGAIGLFMPKFPLVRKEVLRVIGFGIVAISGVLITWYTWGGVYPVKFINHTFFQHQHVNGKPSFGYPFTVFMLAGSTIWLAGNRTINEIKQHQAYSWAVIAFMIIAAIALYFMANIVAIAREASQVILGNHYQIGWILLYTLIGLGWLRVHRDHYPLIFGLLGSAILLITLPYLYERISIFATIAPCLIWCGLSKNEDQQHRLLLPVCSLFVMGAILYQMYGSL
ncbi:hypothetical protein [Spirosoma validum]|uniref:Uncharacterized protein n=1 Tax=Spirosoma validum TaxID=2771355 RepID=A0A927B467_9BACT|nr:hypothetical protein [Spirosoma validum]MBD2755314.1 hypothetical protein [Spirosoma validum]